jgi:hypothetical protein
MSKTETPTPGSDDLRILRDVEGKGKFNLMIFCPGCGHGHGINGKRPDLKPHWTWNGSYEKPTFSPSLLVTGVERLTDEQADRIMAGEKFEPKSTRCHSFIKDGQIQFLNDCTHELAGKTVPLEPF